MRIRGSCGPDSVFTGSQYDRPPSPAAPLCRRLALRGRSCLRNLPAMGLMSAGLFACLSFAPDQVASAGDPKPAAKGASQTAPQDQKASEKVRRDAAGLLTIEGTVVDESGRPVPKARVRLHAVEDRIPTSLTDAEGRFRFLSV